MSSPSPSAGQSESERRLEAVLAEYLRAVERGDAPDQQSFIDRHPEVAAELSSFFENREALDGLAESLRKVVPSYDAPTLGPGGQRTLQPGTAIRYFGDYELLNELDRGGMGIVYKARQTSLNRVVAIKMILGGHLARPAEVQRFRIEAEAAANLSHPNIVPIYEIGEHEGQHYFSMKFIEGGSLAQHRARFTADQRASARLLATVGEALHHAHQHGILHRDVKPANILLDHRDDPHLTDFGLAKLVEQRSDLTQTGAVVGTPSYMAPEQASAQKGGVTTATDVYSLGAVLYELLTGVPPFRSDNPAETLVQVLEQEPVRPRAIDPRIDRDLETICLKCLEKDPARRYASARAFVDDLVRWQSGEPILARPATVVERAIKWARRRPALAALAAVSTASAILLVTALVISHVLISREQEKTLSAYGDLKLQQKATKNALAEQRRTAYGRGIALAHSEWLANNVDRAARVLDDCPADLRHWEWSYLNRLCRGELLSLPGHPNEVRAVAVSPDGKLIASGGGMIGFGPFLSDQQLLLWDAESGRKLGDFRQGSRKGAITGIAFSPDGKLVALALWCMDDARDVVMGGKNLSEDSAGCVEVWDLKEARLVQLFKSHHSFVNGVAFSPDGSRVASAGSDTTANVWDVESGRRLFTLAAHGQIMSVAFSPHGRLIATGGQGPLSGASSMTLQDEGEVKLWNAESGEPLRTLAGHEVGVMSVAFSPDSRLLASASRDKTVRIWDAATGANLRTLFGHGDAVTAVAFSADGERIVTASADRTVRIWNPADGAELRIIRGHAASLAAVAFYPDGERVASAGGGGNSRSAAEIKVWNAMARQDVTISTLRMGEIDRIEISADGKLMAVDARNRGDRPSEVALYDIERGEERWRLSGEDGSVASAGFTADGQKLVTVSVGPAEWAKVWDMATGQRLLTFQVSPPNTNTSFYGGAAAISPDGSQIAALDLDRRVAVVYGTADGAEQLRLSGLTPGSIQFFFDSDGRRLAATSNVRPRSDGSELWETAEVKIWDLRSGKQQFVANPRGFNGVYAAFSPDGKTVLVQGQQDGERVRRWNVETGHELPELNLGALNCYGIRFSPDGAKLVIVHDLSEAGMHVWDLATASELYALNAFDQRSSAWYAGSVAFTPDSRRIITNGDGTTKIWDAQDGQLLLTLRDSLTPLATSGDGRQIVTAGPDGTVKIWQAPALKVK